MLKFKSNNFEELEQEFLERGAEVSEAITRGVIDAVDSDVDSVLVGVMSDGDIDIIVHKPGYKNALELNIKRIEDAELYELCALSKKYIKKLSEM